MLFRIALRNLRLNFRKRLVVMLIIAFSMWLLLLGNTVFNGTDAGIRRAYQDNFTGDFSVSAVSQEPFTLFGNELPLVGDYQVVPVLADAERLRGELAAYPGISAVTGQVSAAALMSLGGVERPCPLFGVNFADYFAFFPQIVVRTGAAPVAGKPGVLLNASTREFFETKLGRPLVLGESIALTVVSGNGFTIRAVPYCGEYGYQVTDSLLDRMALVDVNTARALNGYVAGTDQGISLPKTHTSLLDDGTALDSLFETDADVSNDPGAVALVQDIEKQLSADAGTSGQALEGTWNFLLCKADPRLDAASVADRLAADFSARNMTVQVRDWRGTAGGNATLIYFIRILFNAGMLFVTFIALFVITNSLSLSIHERSKEIGTMRALGASKSKVVVLVSLETLILIGGAAIAGMLGGMLSVMVAGSIGIPVGNPLLAAMFGGSVLRPVISFSQVLLHLLLALGIGVFAMLWPLRIAVRIQPVQAITKD